MLRAVIAAARRLDLWLCQKWGRPYHALLGLGIVIEIVQHGRELIEKPFASAGIVKIALGILLLFALLIHQLGELSEHAERPRRHRD